MLISFLNTDVYMAMRELMMWGLALAIDIYITDNSKGLASFVGFLVGLPLAAVNILLWTGIFRG